MTDNELFGNSEQLDDTISRAAVVDEIEGVDWYHINRNGEMVHGANDAEHQAWYKADDIYAAIERVPSAQPVAKDINVPVKDCISRRSAIDAIMCEPTDAHYPSWYAERLKRLPSAQQWIPTSVRLPEDNEEVLFCDNEGERWLGWHYGFWKTERLDFNEDDVVAWMPLPAPAKIEG